jgi:hypothetical protein
MSRPWQRWYYGSAVTSRAGEGCQQGSRAVPLGRPGRVSLGRELLIDSRAWDVFSCLAVLDGRELGGRIPLLQDPLVCTETNPGRGTVEHSVR